MVSVLVNYVEFFLIYSLTEIFSRITNYSFFRALKESGYESDSTLVFRRREDAASQLSPKEQREAYKIIQKGGDVPLHGLRKPAPDRPKGKCDDLTKTVVNSYAI